MTNSEQKGWALWFVGLPGCGKSSIARAVFQVLRERGLPVVHLEMDARRKVYIPNPTYSAQERDQAYDLFVSEAAGLTARGRGVIMDGTAYRLSMRRAARQAMERFAEVYIHCPLEIAMERERGRPEGLVMAGLFEKALDRRRTGRDYPGLGQVVGVDVPFEEDPMAECVVDSQRLNIAESRDKVLDFLKRWLP